MENEVMYGPKGGKNKIDPFPRPVVLQSFGL